MLDKKDKKDEILDVAEKLFAEQGYEAVSVREISKAADINIAMISYYFGSKEKLYEDVIDRKLISPNIIRTQVDKTVLYKDKLVLVIDAYMEKFFERRQFQNIIYREIAMNHRSAMSNKIATQIHENFLFLSDIIQAGIKKKQFRKVDVEMTVMSIIGIVRMYTTSTMMACKILDIKKETEAFNQKQKIRLRKHLREIIINHLEIK